MDPWGYFTTVLSGIAILLGAWATLKKANTESRQAASNEVEKHIARQDTKIKDQDDHIKRLERRLDAAVIRERLRDDYIMQLRQHIANGGPPPPPAWPEELLHTENYE